MKFFKKKIILLSLSYNRLSINNSAIYKTTKNHVQILNKFEKAHYKILIPCSHIPTKKITGQQQSESYIKN